MTLIVTLSVSSLSYTENFPEAHSKKQIVSTFSQDFMNFEANN